MNRRRILLAVIVAGLLSLLGSSVALAADGDVHLPFMSSNGGQQSVRSATVDDGESDLFLPLISDSRPSAKDIGAANVSMTVKLVNSLNQPIQGGVVKYYSSGWKDFGTTDALGEASKDIPAGTYSFQMTYAGYTQQKSNVNINTHQPARLPDRAHGGATEGLRRRCAGHWRSQVLCLRLEDLRRHRWRYGHQGTAAWHVLLPDDVCRLHPAEVQRQH